MTIYRVSAVLPYITHIPRDIAVNTFWVETVGDMTPTQWTATHSAVAGFYNNVQTTDAVGERISAYVDRDTDACRVELKELGVTGPPMAQQQFTLIDSGGTQSLPFEIAVCLSFGDLIPGVPRGRSRGRVYIGPLNSTSNVISYNPNDPATPDAGFIQDLTEAAVSLGDAMASYDVTWGVYSRVADALYPVVGGWVDNEFDTQRRRQVDATERTTWILS